MRGRDGFTLIELLVVVAILGLLAGLLFPALGRARQRGRTAVCTGHLRQLGLAVQMYVDGSDGRMPVLHNRASITEHLPALDTVLVAQTASSGVFRCPADDQHLFETTGTSYFWNFTVNGQQVTDLFSVFGGEAVERIPLVSDKEPFHPDLVDKVNILYADGHVQQQLEFSTGL